MAPAPQHANTRQHSRTTSASEIEEDSTHMAQGIPWQTVKGMKGKNTGLVNSTTPDIPQDNRFHALTVTRNDDANTGIAFQKAAKPPPIFVYGVTSLPEMQKKFNEFLDEEQYTTRSLANDTIKSACLASDTYRTLARYMRHNGIIHHSYQPKEERSYRVVIKYVHHSVDVQVLRDEISQH